MAYDSRDQQVVLFGGRDCYPGPDCDDTWVYSGGLWTQLHPPVSPTGRRGAAFTYDSVDGYLVLFGGLNDSTGVVDRDTWSFAAGVWMNLTAPTVTASNTPAGRFIGQMADDPADGYTVLFGGCTSPGCGGQLGDTWTFQAGIWSDISAAAGPGPSPRGAAAMVWDGGAQSVLLYGGAISSSAHTNDTWTYSHGAWTARTAALNPGNRGDAWAAYDPSTESVYLFGGLLDYVFSPSSNRPVNDTWRWAAGTWSNATSQIVGSPSARWNLEDAGVYDASEGYGLLFAGGGTSSRADTWALFTGVAPLVTKLSASRTGGGVPLTVSFTLTHTGGLAPFNYSWTFGDGGTSYAASPSHTYGSIGIYLVTVRVEDSQLNVSSQNTTIHVWTALTASLDASPSQLALGQSFTAQTTYSGGNGTITFSWSGLPSGCGVPTSGNLTCVPSASGMWTIEVRVADAFGDASLASANVTVTRVAVPPSNGSGSTNLWGPLGPIGGPVLVLVVGVALVAMGVLLWRRRHSVTPPPAPPTP